MEGPADQGFSLSDVFNAVPDFIPTYLLSLFSKRNEGIRLLRCVSKDVGSHALKAVTSCSLDLSDNAQVLRLVPMVKHAKLLEIKVNAGVVKDASMEALRASLKSVLETVTHLELRARRSLSGKDRVQAIIRCLAAALPALQQLTLTGANSEIGLLSFGTYCPGLSHVKLDARMVPLALVRTMDCLPNLRKVTISNSDTRLSPYHYADALLKYVVKAEIPLEVLDLEGRLSPVFMTILPNSGVWDRLPASLTDLSCSCEMFYCFYNIAAQEFMGRLRFLTLKDGPYLSDLLWMLKCSPQLEKLVVMTDYPPARPLNLTWRSVYKYGPSSMVATTITPEDVTRYKEQLQQGFQIVCECVSLRGPLDNIQKLLTWLTPQPAVTSLTMAKEQAGAKDVRRLADLAFPNLQHVKVV